MGRWRTMIDRYGHEMYLTEERWNHIIEAINHPEMEAYEDHLRQVIQTGRRKQDALNPHKYRYSAAFRDLVEDDTHIGFVFSLSISLKMNTGDLSKITIS